LAALKRRQKSDLEPAFQFLKKLIVRADETVEIKFCNRTLIKLGTSALQLHQSLGADLRISGPQMRLTARGIAGIKQVVIDELDAIKREEGECRKRLKGLELALGVAQADWDRIQEKRERLLERSQKGAEQLLSGGVLKHTQKDAMWPESFPVNDEVLPPFVGAALRVALAHQISESCSQCGQPVRIEDNLQLKVMHEEPATCNFEGETLTNSDRIFLARGYCASDNRVRAWLSERGLF
jgi:hypothetical protein